MIMVLRQEVKQSILISLLIALPSLLIPGESTGANLAPFLTGQPHGIAAPSAPLPSEAISPPTIPEAVHPKLDPRIQSLIKQDAALRKRGKRLPQADPQNRIRVMLQFKEGLPPDMTGILSRNGNVLSLRKNGVTANLPVDRIEEIVTSDPRIAFARLPHKFFPLGVVSQGVELTSAPQFHGAGYRGKGVKIAVLDIGFKGLSEAQASGDLPQNIFTRDFTGRDLQTEYRHGTACAEIVHDMAPEAELHLLKIGDEADLQPALEYCLANQIRVVSLSLVTFGTGPGNGTGPLHDLCHEARASGILIVGGAGNAGNTASEDGIPVGTHWEGVFSDGNQDNIHEFQGRNGNVLIALPAWDDDGNPEHDEVTIGLRWDDWQAVTTDYDLYLYEYDYQNQNVGRLAASSAAMQNGPPGRPYEGILLDMPDTREYQFYYLQVTKKPDSPAGKKLEIYLNGNCYFIGTTAYAQPISESSGSILEPADAESVLAVGAINYSLWSFGYITQEDFSSQGPTNGWVGLPARIKPDICGPDRVATQAYGMPFPGTSAATPHVAGAAALILSEHPNMRPADVQSYLETWAQDVGTTGKDNLCGAGKLRLQVWNSPPVIDWLPDRTVSQGELLRLTVSASDPERDNMTFSAQQYADGASFDPATRTFSWRPDYNQLGQYNATFVVRDDIGPGYGSQNITITVLRAPARGDLNNDYRTDLADALTAIRILEQETPLPPLRYDYTVSEADVNGDARVGMEEVLFILQKVAEIR
jgi:subtilisin family serine protease